MSSKKVYKKPSKFFSKILDWFFYISFSSLIKTFMKELMRNSLGLIANFLVEISTKILSKTLSWIVSIYLSNFLVQFLISRKGKLFKKSILVMFSDNIVKSIIEMMASKSFKKMNKKLKKMMVSFTQTNLFIKISLFIWDNYLQFCFSISRKFKKIWKKISK